MSQANLVLKMVVNTVARHANTSGGTDCEEITLSAVTSDKEGSPNKQWSQWTPCGQLKFTVTNPAALGKVLPGQFFLVHMQQCEKDAI